MGRKAQRGADTADNVHTVSRIERRPRSAFTASLALSPHQHAIIPLKWIVDRAASNHGDRRPPVLLAVGDAKVAARERAGYPADGLLRRIVNVCARSTEALIVPTGKDKDRALRRHVARERGVSAAGVSADRQFGARRRRIRSGSFPRRRCRR